MYVKAGLSRKELVPLLLDRAPVEGVQQVGLDALGRKLGSGFIALWPQNPASVLSLPSVLIAPEHEVRDLVAWLWTYTPDLRPVTSFVRILTPQTFDAAARLVDSPSLGPLEGSWIGLILAESAIDAGDRQPAFRPSYAQCLSTATFVEARAAALGYEHELTIPLFRAWSRIRGQASESQGRTNWEFELKSAWDFLRSAGAKDLFRKTNYTELPRASTNAFYELVEFKSIQPKSWAMLVESRPLLKDAREISDSSREARVRLFETFVQEIRMSGASTPDDAFLVAYLANQVSPGSFEHFQLVRSGVPNPMTACTWYGLIAGATGGSAIYNAFGGLGRRLVRELNRGAFVLDRPLVDVDFQEFEVAFESTRGEAAIQGATPGFINVGLLPGISVRTSIGNQEIQASESSRRSEEIAYHLQRLERALGEVSAEFDRLAGRYGLRNTKSHGYNRSPRRKPD